LSAGSDRSHAVIFKVSEAVGAPLKELHLSMEAFSDGIVFDEPPRGRNFSPPAQEGFGRRLHGSELFGFVPFDIA
jgi:hypothetical protein